VTALMNQQKAEVTGDPNQSHNRPPQRARQHEGGNEENRPMYVDVNSSYTQDCCKSIDLQGQDKLNEARHM